MAKGEPTFMKKAVNKMPRWQDYVFHNSDSSSEFWRKLLAAADRELLMIVGRGFDPRMCVAPKALLEAGGKGKRDCLLLTYEEEDDSPSRAHWDQVEANREELEVLFRGVGRIFEKKFDVWNRDSYVGSRRAAHHIDAQLLESYTDVVVDISAMPRGIYFSVLGKILHILDDRGDSTRVSKNLHAVVTEDVKLDQEIREQKRERSASYVHGFSAQLQRKFLSALPTIWIPILGEDKADQLKKIHKYVQPDEICPVLPSPSSDPRRSDNLVTEYRELLFDDFRVEPTNVIHACEWNPFEAYRQIRRAIVHYDESLKALGGCKAVISAASSKLLSIGALLAAWDCMKNDLAVGIATVEPRGYDMKEMGDDSQSQEVHTMWLAGECYDE